MAWRHASCSGLAPNHLSTCIMFPFEGPQCSGSGPIRPVSSLLGPRHGRRHLRNTFLMSLGSACYFQGMPISSLSRFPRCLPGSPTPGPSWWAPGPSSIALQTLLHRLTESQSSPLDTEHTARGRKPRPLHRRALAPLGGRASLRHKSKTTLTRHDLSSSGR